MEKKKDQTLRKLNYKFSDQEYKMLHPLRSLS